MNKQPDTVMNLYEDIPIANGQQIGFTSRAKQSAYFNARRLRQITGNVYLRHTTGEVKVSGETSQVMKANYLSFNNQSFDGQPFYGAIVDFEYLNNDTVKIFFEIDWWQTFMFDAKWRSSRVEREHLSEIGWQSAVANPYRNDIPELLTDEGLTTGEEYEVDYKRTKGLIADNGKHAISQAAVNTLSPTYRPGFEIIQPTGQDHLVTQFGTNFAIEDPQSTIAVVMHIATSEWVTSRLNSTWKPYINTVMTNVEPEYDAYANGFGRGYTVVVVNAGATGTNSDEPDGTNTARAENVKAILDDMAANGATSSILGMWVVPFAMLQSDLHFVISKSYSNGGVLAGGRTIPRVTIEPLDYNDIPGYPSIVNPKLRRFPFRYLRVTDPGGSSQGFEIERFSDPDSCGLRVYSLFDDVPSVTVAPEGYNGHSLDYKRRLVYNTLPQMGYVTDSFLTYLSSMHQQALVNATPGDVAAAKNPLNQISEKVTGAVQGLTRLATGDFSGPDRIQDAGRDSAILRQAEAAGNLDAGQWGAVRAGDVSAGPFDGQRAAFTADIYHAGNAAGSLGRRLEQDYFECVQVTLRGHILSLYDDFLTAYGYSSTRIGVPRVAGWVHGQSDVPHFVQFDGMRFTYVKTESAKVYGVLKVAAAAIGALFDNGVRMLDGDLG